MIPKSGGNIFSGSLFAGGTGSGLQSNNLTSDLQSQGLSSVNGIREVYDYNGVLGGQIVKDRLWFFGSARRWGTTTSVANLSADANESLAWDRHAGGHVEVRAGPHQADLSGGNRPRVRVSLHGQAHRQGQVHVFVRQAAELSGSVDRSAGDGDDQERGQRRILPGPGAHQGTWTRPQSTKLLFDAGLTVSQFTFGGFGNDLFLSDYQACGGGWSTTC